MSLESENFYKKATLFLKEYKELCFKHGLFIQSFNDAGEFVSENNSEFSEYMDKLDSELYDTYAAKINEETKKAEVKE